MSKTTHESARSFPYACEVVSDIRGNVNKVVLSLRDYEKLLEALEHAGLLRAMKAVHREKLLLHKAEALAVLEAE